jgi:Na+/melibiose symporter-like transporter
MLGKNLKRFWNEPPSGRFLNFKEILRLGISSLGVSFIANFISIYITISNVPLLYDMGNSGTLHATIMYLLASVLALFITPLYGKMMQRTKTKFGRYKPYILFLAPIVAVLGVLAVWSPTSLTQNQRIIYVYMICTPTIFLWNLWYNTFNMFPGVFTPNQQERADIWSPIGLVIGFAPTIMNAVKGLVIAWKGDIWAGRIYGILSAVLGMVCIIALLGVKERVFITEEENKSEKVTALEGLKMIVKNKPLMILTLAICLGSLKNTIDLCWDVMARVKYAGDVQTAVALIGGLSLFVGFAATPNMILLPWMTRKFNNRTILLFWQGCNVTANLVLAIIGFQNFPQGSWSPYVITFLRFVSMFNALGSLQPLMLSEIGDMQQVKSGYRLEGFIQTFAYSLTAVVAQVAAIIPAVIQSKMGFNPANYQVPEGSDKFILDQHYVEIAENYGNVALWISVVSSALMLICLIFYDLDKRKHAEIVKQLKASAVNADEIAQEEGTLHILEKVTDTEEDNLMKELSEEINESDDSATQDTETSADSLEKTDGDSLMEDK